MSNKKAQQPRQPKSVQVTDEPSYIKNFRQDLLARGLSTNTRNAYVRDLMACEQTNPIALSLWQSDSVLTCLSLLQLSGKNARSQARA